MAMSGFISTAMARGELQTLNNCTFSVWYALCGEACEHLTKYNQVHSGGNWNVPYQDQKTFVQIALVVPRVKPLGQAKRRYLIRKLEYLERFQATTSGVFRRSSTSFLPCRATHWRNTVFLWSPMSPQPGSGYSALPKSAAPTRWHVATNTIPTMCVVVVVSLLLTRDTVPATRT